MSNKLNLSRELRLLTPSDFNYVFSQSSRSSSPFLTFVYRPNNLTHPRLGFTIAKKQVKRAHERNRLKRLAREYVRLRQHQLPAVDIVVMARTPVIELSNAEIRAVLDKLCQRIIATQSKNS